MAEEGEQNEQEPGQEEMAQLNLQVPAQTRERFREWLRSQREAQGDPELRQGDAFALLLEQIGVEEAFGKEDQTGVHADREVLNRNMESIRRIFAHFEERLVSMATETRSQLGSQQAEVERERQAKEEEREARIQAEQEVERIQEETKEKNEALKRQAESSSALAQREAESANRLREEVQEMQGRITEFSDLLEAERAKVEQLEGEQEERDAASERRVDVERDRAMEAERLAEQRRWELESLHGSYRELQERLESVEAELRDSRQQHQEDLRRHSQEIRDLMQSVAAQRSTDRDDQTDGGTGEDP